MNQQAAVYQGKLKDVQRNQYSSKEKLYEKTKDRFVDAKISKVEHGVVEIGLID